MIAYVKKKMIGEIRQNFTEASASVGLILATALPILDSTRHHWLHCNWKVTLNFSLFIYFVSQFESQCCMLQPVILYWGARDILCLV